ncbi:unnamed protein product [Orchesella dallaii]|uniref:Kazal-like domain-containing protein n=1 Tax=Orchesella dallaii TaxID=48710 RepID=A0ABP1PNJ5_9HEXA
MWMDIAQEADPEPRSDEEDTVYDRTDPYYGKNPFEGEAEDRIMLEEPETRCGFGTWRPHWLQTFSNKTFFSVMFTIVGVIHGSFWTYYTATISTFEKRFSMDSTTSGVLLFANELAQILVAIVFTYFGFRRHRAKMLTLGLALSSISCFFIASPHYYLGSGDMVVSLIRPVPSSQNMALNALPHSERLIALPEHSVELTEDAVTFISSIETTISSNISAQITNDSTTPASLSTNDSTLTDAPTTLNNTNSSDVTQTSENSTNSTDSASSSTTEQTTKSVSSSLPPEVTTEELPSSILPYFPPREEDEDFDVDSGTISQTIPYLNVWPVCNPDAETIGKNATVECKRKGFERTFAFSFIFCANFIGGMASMLFLLSGGPFAEDSTIMPNELPRIFGITLALRMIGPFFGYLFAWSCLSEFINPTVDVVQIDNRWLGAWWLGWTFLGIFMAISALIFSLFPRQSPREFLKKRSLTHETGSAMLLIPSFVTFFGSSELKTANLLPTITNFLDAFQGLLRNKVYFFMTFSTLVHIFVGIGYWTFLPKYLEFMFRLKAADAAMLTGVSSVPLQVAGLMLGGAFISRYMPSSKEISSWNAIVTILQIIGLFVVAFVGCSTSNIDLSFQQHTQQSNTSEVSSLIAGTGSDAQHCSADCDCVIGPILPVCDLSSGTTFYSPCFAGCEKVVNQTNFIECSCLPHSNSSGSLIEGFCPSNDCSNGLITFLVLTCLSQFLSSSAVVGRMLMSFKSVQANQRTAIIGLTLLILSLISIIPSPIVFGSLFESACSVREETCGDQLGNCWLYDDATLRFAYNLGTAAFLTIAFIFDALLWKTQRVYEMRIYDGELTRQTAALGRPTS